MEIVKLTGASDTQEKNKPVCLPVWDYPDKAYLGGKTQFIFEYHSSMSWVPGLNKKEKVSLNQCSCPYDSWLLWVQCEHSLKSMLPCLLH